MREYWHKKPLLIRQAIPQITNQILPQDILDLALHDEVESRLVRYEQAQWHLEQGPFARLPSRRRRDWTILVQGVNLFHPVADQLLQQFSFLPDARLDDVMASYATPGGGVGAHFDSYDVFLLQVHGRREWQISAQADLSLQEGLPLKILRHFKPEQKWVLEPGDMLYLPPHIAHNGIAVDECVTCSIGFRAPNYVELADGFLGYMSESLSTQVDFSDRYADPEQTAVSYPAELPRTMVKKISQQLRKIKWDDQDVSQFLGCYLSEPKPHIFFDPPAMPLSAVKFKRAALKYGVQLSSRSRALYDPIYFYLNGEKWLLPSDKKIKQCLLTLADERALSSVECAQFFLDPECLEWIYNWFSDGWVELIDER